jgi:hypothetical protein
MGGRYVQSHLPHLHNVKQHIIGKGGLYMFPGNFGRMPPQGLFGRPGAMGGFAGRAMPNPGMGARGGLLQGLFQRQPAAGGIASHFARGPQTGGFLQNLMNPGTIQSFLNNTQTVLKTAQQIGPLVQQYGPLIRNLPAMWRLYKSFSSDSAAEDKENQNESTADAEEQEEKNETAKTAKSPKKEEDSKKAEKPRSRTGGKSVPKLYI